MGLFLTTYCIYVIYFESLIRHHKNDHNIPADENETEERQTDQGNQDFMFNYHIARLQFELFLNDLNDAIKEGDGERLFKCLKIALSFFYKYKHTKLLMLLFCIFARSLQSFLSMMLSTICTTDSTITKDTKEATYR